MLIETFRSLPGALEDTNIPWLPLPNRVDVVLSDVIAPLEITATAFCFPFYQGRLILAVNRRRGPEVPGGHRDLLLGTVYEAPVVTAIRETLEETGAVVSRLFPIGFHRHICEGANAPEGYKYSFPESAQQFFAAEVEELLPYEDNDECLQPISTDSFFAANYLSPRNAYLAQVARTVLNQ